MFRHLYILKTIMYGPQYPQSPPPMSPPPPPMEPHPHHQYGAPPTHRSSGPYPWVIPMVMLIIVAILLMIALWTAWWHTETIIEIETDDGDSGEVAATADFSSDEIYGTVDFSGSIWEGYDDDEETGDWNDMENPDGDDLDNMEETFKLANTLTIITLILVIIAIVFVIIGGMRYISFKVTWTIVLVTLLVSIISPVYFAASIGDACKKDDWPGEDGKLEYDFGSKKSDIGPIGFISSHEDSFKEDEGKVKLSLNAYPTTGWFMAFIGIFFILIAFIMVHKLNRKIGPPRYGTHQRYSDYNVPPSAPPQYGAPPPLPPPPPPQQPPPPPPPPPPLGEPPPYQRDRVWWD